jgi:hypothetical protein
MGRRALFQQATSNDRAVVEGWTLAQVRAIEHACSEALFGVEAEAERRHRQVMDDAARAHAAGLGAAAAQKQAVSAALAQARDELTADGGGEPPRVSQLGGGASC